MQVDGCFIDDGELFIGQVEALEDLLRRHKWYSKWAKAAAERYVDVVASASDLEIRAVARRDARRLCSITIQDPLRDWMKLRDMCRCSPGDTSKDVIKTYCR